MAPATTTPAYGAPQPLPFSRKWHLAKIIIRIWSTLFATLILILSIVVATKANQLLALARQAAAEDDDSDSSYDYYYGSYYSYYGAYSRTLSWAVILWMFATPPAALVICWNTAEFVTLCVRRNSKLVWRGIHPGAHVGMDLIIWLGTGMVWGMIAAVVTWIPIYDYDSDTESYIVDNETFDFSVRNYAIAIMVFMILLFCIHFFLFIRACIDTNKRNRYYKNLIMMPMPAPQQPQPVGPIPYPYYTGYPSVNPHQSMYYPPPQQPQLNEKGEPIAPQTQQQQGPPMMPYPMMAPPPQQPGSQQQPPQNTDFAGFYAPSPPQGAMPTPPPVAQAPPPVAGPSGSAV